MPKKVWINESTYRSSFIESACNHLWVQSYGSVFGFDSLITPRCRWNVDFFSDSPCIGRPYRHNTMMPHVIYRCRLTKDLPVNESINPCWDPYGTRKGRGSFGYARRSWRNALGFQAQQSCWTTRILMVSDWKKQLPPLKVGEVSQDAKNSNSWAWQ